ncbi:hypothetical protein Tco_0012120 [Tanacetum coccineum]
MDENHINGVMEVIKQIDLNKQAVEYNNELESDTKDILPEITDPDAVIEEVTEDQIRRNELHVILVESHVIMVNEGRCILYITPRTQQLPMYPFVWTLQY